MGKMARLKNTGLWFYDYAGLEILLSKQYILVHFHSVYLCVIDEEINEMSSSSIYFLISVYLFSSFCLLCSLIFCSFLDNVNRVLA